MRATVIYGPHDIRLEQVPDPVIQLPTDALVRVVAACVCGSDLWPYRGINPTPHPRRIGHEFVGVVEAVGSAVTTVAPGDFVVAPFTVSDNTCVHCRNGVQTSCVHGGSWGAVNDDGLLADGGQGEYIRVPYADGTLVVAPGTPDDALLTGVLACSDVMGTGHHAARSARVGPGSTVVVVGDGAVGLCAVIAAKRLGAGRIVAMSRNPSRQALATRFGATDLVAERGPEGVAHVLDLLDGVGADSALECVGTKESMQQALDVARPGGTVGFVGVPAGGPELSVGQMFGSNVGVVGGVAPVRYYIPELLPDVWAGAIEPGLVFDLTLPLDQVADAYAAMDQRRAVKVMLRP
ncbi:MAG TPA: zinc-dependent alcohol dehydrogenase family protein [Cellulomonas sp.]